jgi:uncharacterized protein involved in exopolysaccharide biosynthesis
MTTTARPDADTIDVAELVTNIRRGWPAVLGGIAFGLLVAVGVIFFVPARFSATSSIIDRASESPAGALRSKLTGSLAGAAADLLPGGLGGASTPVETEMQVLSSRALAGEGVDSLGLQLRIRGPRRLPSNQIFVMASFPGSFKKRTLEFRQIAGGRFHVSGSGQEVDVSAGVEAEVGGGRITLARTDLPDHFNVDVYDREEAITRFQRKLAVSKAGGEVLDVAFQADDSLTAAAVPNLLVRRYLERRRTSDRGVNQRRVDFLSLAADSIERALTGAENALRRQQEASGVLDPVVVGKLTLERAGELRKEAGTLDVERGALGQMLDQLAQGRLTPRQVAAFPTFLRSQGINDLLSQLSTLETKRLQLLSTLTAQDPAVLAATEGVKNIEAQLPPLARVYASSLDRERADISRQLDTLTSAIERLPTNSEAGLRLQRNVLQLAQVNAAVRAQLVEAKLDAVGDGGDVRLLDVAQPPRKVSFPQPALTLAAGAGAGLVIGVLVALFAGFFGRYVPDARSIERQIGVPALALDPAMPFVVSGVADARTLLLIPLDENADTAGVAERLMRTALSRDLQSTVLDLSIAGSGSTGLVSNINALSAQFDLVVVRLPELASDISVGALRENRPVIFVATAGRVDRRRLSAAVDSLSRLSVPCAGVVLSRQAPRSLTAIA